MVRVTRNLLTLLVVGFMLFSYPNADAQYQSYYYSIDVDKYDFWPDRTSYDIKIRDKSRYNPCRYGCIKPDMVCANGIHVPRVPDMFEKYQTLKQQRQRERLMTAETELLEAQTALARYQLRQAKQANRVQPTPAQQEAKQRSARKRLVQRAALAQSTDRADQAVQAREEAREETRQWKKYQDELDMWVTFVRTGAIGADTALKRYAINHPTKPVYPLRRRLKEAGLLHKQTNSRLSKVVEVLELVKAGKLTSEEAIAFCRTLYNKPKKHTGLSNGRMLTVGHTDDISLP